MIWHLLFILMPPSNILSALIFYRLKKRFNAIHCAVFNFQLYCSRHNTKLNTINTNACQWTLYCSRSMHFISSIYNLLPYDFNTTLPSVSTFAYLILHLNYMPSLSQCATCQSWHIPTLLAYNSQSYIVSPSLLLLGPNIFLWILF